MTSRKRLVLSYCCLALLLAVLFAVSLFWGSVALTPQAVLAALTGRGQDALSVGIITQLRLPRAVMAALLGAALSAAGYLLQTFFANPIAGPFVMGISSGAKLAVALVMVLFLNYGLLTSSAVLILAAFAGAMAAMAFVLAAAGAHLYILPLRGSRRLWQYRASRHGHSRAGGYAHLGCPQRNCFGQRLERQLRQSGAAG